MTPEEFKATADRIIGLYPEKRSALIPLCHLYQEKNGYLDDESIAEIAMLLDLTAAEVRGTASFYDMLFLEPVGRYLIGVCTNVACMLTGSDLLMEHAKKKLGIEIGATTDDGNFTLEETECLAHCDKAPCLQVNHRFFGPLSEEEFDRLIEDLKSEKLSDEVPTHGTLLRFKRKLPLTVQPNEIAAERKVMDEAIARRKGESS
jgi:NADH-quinone oxidoreductase subunit E